MSNGLNALPPKTAFFAGLAGGALSILAIGFFVLLANMLTGGSFSFGGSLDSSRKAARNAGALDAPTPALAPSPTREVGEAPRVTGADHIRGNPDAAITLIEYSDFECPFCKRFHPTMLQVLEKYPDDVRWIWRHFPLSFHANAQKEAEATECAGELGGNDAFWKYTDVLFERTASNGTGFALTALAPLARELGLDQSKFQACLDSDKYAQHVRDEMNSGSAAGVSGTPGTIVIGRDGKSQLIPGALPFESIDQVIQSLL